MIVVDNPLLQDDLESDEEVESMEIAGVLKSGKVSQTKINTVNQVNNVAKLKERLKFIQKQLPWIETVDVTVNLKTTADEMKAIINDNFKQEMLFYKQAQFGATQALTRLKSMNIPTTRPQDYFAEMVKSDDHMKRVKERLVSKQLQLEKTEKVTKIRKMKRLGKKVQQEVQKKRAEEKKAMLDSVKKIRKGQQQSLDAMDNDEFDIQTEAQEQGKSKKKDLNRKRKAKDSKYGFGGKKKFARKNTQDSYNDTSSFSSRVHSTKAKHLNESKKRKQRPGKNKRVQIKLRNKK